MSVSQRITQRLKDADRRYHANDNISDMIEEGELPELIEELTVKFEDVLKGLVIDIENDPNSKETGHRLAKMYVNEIMSGRYVKAPKVTAFPNEKNGNEVDMVRLTPVTDHDSGRPAYAYSGLLVVRAEIISMCSHHHQPVKGIAYIGIVPGAKVIGLSKYIRLAQHCALRGTLQEQLTADILHAVQQASDTKDVAVWIQATHGCVTHRGVKAHNSTTQSVELGGAFMIEPELRKEFYDNIKLQEANTKV